MQTFFRTNSIFNAALLIGIGGIVSRLLGLLRDRLLAGTFGATRELDIYYAAFRIPDFIYAILILGAISAAFIPIFNSLESREEQSSFASAALNLVTLAVAGISLLLFLFASLVIDLIAPGFTSEEKMITVFLTRIMLLQPIILSMSNVITSILQSSNKFFMTALAPSFYNIGIIIGIVAFFPTWGLTGLAFGVVLGALLHFLIQVPALVTLEVGWRPIFSLTQEVKKMLTLMGPRIFGIASDQVNLIVITAIASTLSFGSIAVFNLAQNIQGAPVGVVGIALATAVFPTLSLSFFRTKREEFANVFLRTFRLILFFGIPLSVLFILLRAQVVRVILGTGQFGWEDTRLTAAALGIFGISVFAQSLTPLLTRVFYSMQDTKTPVVIGVGGVVLNIISALYLVSLLTQPSAFSASLATLLKLQGIADISVIALPLAFSLTEVVKFLFLLMIALTRIDGDVMRDINTTWLKIVFSSSIMAGITYLSLRPLSSMVDMETGFGVFFQGLGAGIIGILSYFVITWLVKENPLVSYQKMKNNEV